jgi:hypothetical protein
MSRHFDFPVETGQVLAFARALGDRGDDGVPPPTFAAASAHFDPESPLRPVIGEPWFGSGRGPGSSGNVVTGVLHGEQHFEYHRPLQVGETLTVEVHDGATTHKVGRRGGPMTLTDFVTEYRDGNGELVITARHVSVRMEVQ